MLEQIGLLPEIEDISLPTRKCKIKRHDQPDSNLGRLDASFLQRRYGYPTLIVPRPALYNVLLSKIPKHKIVLGKRVLSTSQSDHGVLVRCADGSTFSGNILVGADGANSSVRQNLYRQLETMGSIAVPSASQANLNTAGNSAEDKSKADSAWAVMGITNPLDSERYPALDEPFSDFIVVMGQKSRESVIYVPAANRRLLWTITTPIEKAERALLDDGFKATEFGPEAIEEVCSRFIHFEGPYGGTLKEILDQSPHHLRSKVLVQEKIFERWHGGRTVLLGNACHKFPPSAGVNDNINMAEAVHLANYLYKLQSNNSKEINVAFERYQEDRSVYARRALHLSKQIRSFFSEKGIVADISRKVTSTWSSSGAWLKEHDLVYKDRPQAVFLPMVPQRGELLRPDPIPSTFTVSKHGTKKSVTTAADTEA
ncbi:hypothetical protein BGZ99_007392 [Dissophora globulifera]|uniref:FAD-binding domain-containing protein n=1 Tax=Dissophora globulifera TaxID=979702 RepID=A0A9P6UZB7_9FUNG|nr:hypothetical protein BGZ99_007392 [Dissophora globulifera]